MRKPLLLFSLFLCSVVSLIAQNNIIPAPVSYENNMDMFMVDNSIFLDDRTNDATAHAYANDLLSYLNRASINTSFKKVDSLSQQRKAIRFELESNELLGNEGYELEVKELSVNIKANKPAGIFNAIQTLKQLLPREFESIENPMGFGMIMGCKIVDYPRLEWRGLMLDVSRHFFTVEEVKDYLLTMSKYKFNVMHWHLTDDEGWRIEIKSLPKLTEVGAWRVPRDGKFGEGRAYPKEGEKATEGGFYTQEQIKEVVAYAKTLNITIVPEIDIPGHSMAALAAYPELSVDKEPKFVNPGAKFAEWPAEGGFYMLIDNTLNPTDEKVYEFVDKVMTEVAALFPSEYIHMGGDECYHGYWEKNPGVQKFMNKKNIADSHALQSYFVTRVQKIINAKGKKMIGWDEILEGGLAEGAAVMSWQGMKGGIEAAKLGHKVVMSPTTYAYLDYSQGDHSVEFPIYSDLYLKKAYEFEPIPDGVDSTLIMGGQANLWTEQIKTLHHAYYMTYPRALANIEATWSPKSKRDWNSFTNRLESHFGRFDAAQKSISRAVYDPVVKVKEIDGKLTVRLSCELQNVDIYYTYDNSFPDQYRDKATGDIVIPEGDLSLKVVTYRNGRQLGRMLSIPRADLVKRAGMAKFQF